MPVVLWKCAECGTQIEGGMRPPEGWLEVSFWNGVRFIRHSFDSYRCASLWCGKRYDKIPREEKYEA